MTFEQAGTYQMYCAVSDGTNVVNSNLTVNVTARATFVSVSPDSVTMNPGATQQFTASAVDQFGHAMPSAVFTWTRTGGGSINSTGLYTAGSSNATVRATSGSVFGTASVTVNNNAPTVAQPAAADPQTGTSVTVALSVLGADDNGGEAALTYTWSNTARPAGAPIPTFSVNGNNGAKNTIVTLTRAGNFTFVVTISDGGKSTTSSVNVTSQQKTTTVVVSPSSVTVSNGATQQFTAVAKDQFGQNMVTQPNFTWSVSGNGPAYGTISPTGLYTAPTSGVASDTVTAFAQGSLSGAVTGTASVYVGQQQPSIFTSEAGVGSPGVAGSHTYSNGTYTVRGGGRDIWDWNDQFHYVYKPFTGDGSIVARVTSVQNTHTYAKAGVMFRESLVPESKQATMLVKPDFQASFQRRTETWGTTVQTPWQTVSGPYWLKLTRSGSTFTAYTSSDGVNWTSVGSETIAMNATIYVGLAVTSHDNNVLNTSTFTNVSVTNSAGAAARSSEQTTTTMSASMNTTDGSNAANDSNSTTTTSSVKVNVPLTNTAGKTLTRKPVSVKVNVPVGTKAKPADVPDVQTYEAT